MGHGFHQWTDLTEQNNYSSNRRAILQNKIHNLCTWDKIGIDAPERIAGPRKEASEQQIKNMNILSDYCAKQFKVR